MITPTMGAVALGLGLLVRHLITWWPGTKKLQSNWMHFARELTPFAYAWCFGMLAILCVGGLIGAATDFVLWGSNWLGDAAYVWGVGGPSQVSVGRSAVSALTAGGSWMFLILTFVFFALLKKNEHLRRDMLLGSWCGICLGLSKGIAGAAAVPLASLVNLSGAWITGVIA